MCVCLCVCTYFSLYIYIYIYMNGLSRLLGTFVNVISPLCVCTDSTKICVRHANIMEDLCIVKCEPGISLLMGLVIWMTFMLRSQ